MLVEEEWALTGAKEAAPRGCAGGVRQKGGADSTGLGSYRGSVRLGRGVTGPQGTDNRARRKQSMGSLMVV